jgi:hypothetical protein
VGNQLQEVPGLLFIEKGREGSGAWPGATAAGSRQCGRRCCARGGARRGHGGGLGWRAGLGRRLGVRGGQGGGTDWPGLRGIAAAAQGNRKTEHGQRKKKGGRVPRT